MSPNNPDFDPGTLPQRDEDEIARIKALIADTGATAGPYNGDGIVDTNAGETAAGEASSSSSGQPQNPRRVLIIVGDPGLGEHNSGRNLDRVAATKKEELEAQGDTAIVQRASGFQDFANALTNNGVLDGVEYVGHASNIALYVGEQPGPATNVDHSNIPQLSNANLSKNAYVKLNGCNSSAGGTVSIAQWLANRLGRTVTAFTGPSHFSGSPKSPQPVRRGDLPPARGPLYLVGDPGTKVVHISPG